MKLENETAVVTGAASGIGRAIAISLAKRGCHLALADIDMAGLEDTKRLIASNAVRISLHKLDVSDAAEVAAFPDTVIAAHGGASVLVNNAGVAVGGTFEEIAPEDFEWLMRINFWGVVRMTRAFLPLLRKAPKAHIANVSSLFGLIAPPGQSAYSASKFAVKGFTDALRHELAGSSISVTTIHPGGVNTSIARSARTPKSVDPAEREKTLAGVQAMLRLPPAEAGEQIAKAIETGRPRLLIGGDAKMLALLERLFPNGYWRILGKVMRLPADRR